MGDLSEAEDEHSIDQQLQGAFMQLKRVKRLLTSAFPDRGKALFSNTVQIRHKDYGTESKSINVESQRSCVSSQCLCNNKHLFSGCCRTSMVSMDKLNKPIIPLKQNVLKRKKTVVQSCRADMT